MTDGESQAAGPLAGPLTRREREILGLLAQGYSAPEIAQQLTVAVSSVKSHIQHLYGKLGVNGKRPALTRARVRGLRGPAGAGGAAPPPAQPATVAPVAVTPPAFTPLTNLPPQTTAFVG